MSIRMRHTRGHTGNRRSHHALSGANLVKDENNTLRLPHRLNEATGMYRGKQIAPAIGTKVQKEKKIKGPDTEPEASHTHEHAHEEHANAEVKGSKGILGQVFKSNRPKARSGFGGGNSGGK
jgi:ribosomal protein L32